MSRDWKILVILGPFLLLGCSREPAVVPPVPSQATSPAADPGASPANLDATLAELTQAVRKFGVEQRRTPKELPELVAHGYLPSIPAAPAGKKFAIDKQMRVYLADQ